MSDVTLNYLGNIVIYDAVSVEVSLNKDSIDIDVDDGLEGVIANISYDQWDDLVALVNDRRKDS